MQNELVAVANGRQNRRNNAKNCKIMQNSVPKVVTGIGEIMENLQKSSLRARADSVFHWSLSVSHEGLP